MPSRRATAQDVVFVGVPYGVALAGDGFRVIEMANGRQAHQDVFSQRFAARAMAERMNAGTREASDRG